MRQPASGRKIAVMVGGGVALATVLAVALRMGTRPPDAAITLPDGSTYDIPALPFARPTTRQAAGLERQWQEAGAAYQTGDYAKSERLFGRIERLEPAEHERHDATLYRGIALLLSGNHAEAVEVLERARSLAAASGLGNSADNYYLGLSALARRDPQAGRAALERAVGGAFDREARTLLAQLPPR